MTKTINQRDLESLKRDELYQLAQELKIKGRSKMTKAELIGALKSLVAAEEHTDNSVFLPKEPKVKSTKKDKNKQKSLSNKDFQESLPKFTSQKALPKYSHKNSDLKKAEKSQKPQKQAKPSKNNTIIEKPVLENDKTNAAKTQPIVDKTFVDKEKTIVKDKKASIEEKIANIAKIDKSEKTDETLAVNEQPIADRSNKKLILSRSFAKEKKESYQRNKKGALVKSVAIPVELFKQGNLKQPIPNPKQIEEERFSKHASLKTTMEIPVSSTPTSKLTKQFSEEDLTGDLPSDYGETKIVIQIRDPHWAHAYWQIPKSALKKLEMQLGIFEFAHSHFVLRIHNVSDGFTQEFSLSEHARSHYFYLENANSLYQAELGLQSPTEGYTFIALSNIIKTPPDRVSDNLATFVSTQSSLEDEDRIAGHALTENTKSLQQTSLVEEITEPEKVFHKAITTGADLPALLLPSSGSHPSDVSAPVGPSKEEEAPAPAPVSSFEAPLPVSSPVSSVNLPISESGSFIYKPAQENLPDTDIFLTATPELILYGMVDKRCLLDLNGQNLNIETDGSFSVRFMLPVNQQKALELKALEPKSGKTKTIRATVKFEIL